MIARLIPVVELQHILVIQVVKNADLVHQFLTSHAIYRLDGDKFDGLLLSPLVNDRVFATADLLINVIVVHLCYSSYFSY